METTSVSFCTCTDTTCPCHPSNQHLCEKFGMRKEDEFKEFVSFINNPDSTPKYENTLQYAILKKEWN